MRTFLSKRVIFLAVVLMAVGVMDSGLMVNAAQEPVEESWVCFPTCGHDGKMLVIPGQGQNTMAGFSLKLSFNAAPEADSFQLSVFDGESGGLWDIPGSSNLLFELYNDPAGDGTGDTGTPVATWLGATMADNAWSDLPAIETTSDAQVTLCETCPYRYLLVISNLNNAANGLSTFKVRTTGTLGLRPQAFAFLNPRTSNQDIIEVSPQYPALMPSLYDGAWRFAFFVPSQATQITMWDGDLDWGSYDCLTKDTDDPDTPVKPSLVDPLLSFLETPAVSEEGVAVGTITCADGSKATGSPADNSNPSTGGQRHPMSGLGPNLLYRILLPNGTEYVNLEPSGNREWERFKLDADPNTPFDRSQMDIKVPSLPAGVYETLIEGNDTGNLNFFYANYNLLGLPPGCCNPPAREDAFYTIDRYVWHDLDGDGIKEDGEPGISGVLVERNDTTTNEKIYSMTDSTGLFSFRVPEGDYSLTILAGNFDAGKPLNSLVFTGGNGFGAESEFEDGLALGPGNMHERRDFGYVNRRPTANDDEGFCLCNASTTINVLANDTDPAGDTLTVTGVTQPAHGSVTFTANGNVAYTASGDGFTGEDTFTYTVSDGHGNSVVGTVTINATNGASFLGPDSATVTGLTPVTIAVLANDSDPNGGQTLTIASVTQPSFGTVVINPDRTVTYTPTATTSATDTFTYTVSDGCGSVTTTVTITRSTPPPPAVCYVGSRNPNVGASQTWVPNTNGTMTLRTTLSQLFNDNSYGANQIGWPGRNHKYNHLVTSDMVQLALFDKNGARKMEFKLDYFSASTSSATGWQSLGTWGGDGAMILGSQAHIKSADSSLAMNFRQGPSYILTVDSPAIPNTTHPNWIFEMWYEVTVDPAAFGTVGFGYPRIVAMHASPSKSGVETEPLVVVNCAGNVTPANHDGGSPNGTAGGNANGQGKKK